MNLRETLDALAAGVVDHRAEGEALASQLARHREERVDIGIRLDSLRIAIRRAEHPRHLRAGEIAGPRAALRDGPGGVAPGRDATEQSLITMGLARPARKATT